MQKLGRLTANRSDSNACPAGHKMSSRLTSSSPGSSLNKLTASTAAAVTESAWMSSWASCKRTWCETYAYTCKKLKQALLSGVHSLSM